MKKKYLQWITIGSLALLVLMALGFVSMPMGQISPTGTGDIELQAQDNATFASSQIGFTKESENSYRLATSPTNFTDGALIEFQVRAEKTQPGEVLEEFKFMTETFSSETDTSDSNSYKLISEDNDELIECSLDGIQESGRVNIGEDSASKLLSVVCKASGDLNHLEQFSSKLTRLYVGSDSIDLEIMRSE